MQHHNNNSNFSILWKPFQVGFQYHMPLTHYIVLHLYSYMYTALQAANTTQMYLVSLTNILDQKRDAPMIDGREAPVYLQGYM